MHDLNYSQLKNSLEIILQSSDRKGCKSIRFRHVYAQVWNDFLLRVNKKFVSYFGAPTCAVYEHVGAPK